MSLDDIPLGLYEGDLRRMIDFQIGKIGSLRYKTLQNVKSVGYSLKHFRVGAISNVMPIAEFLNSMTLHFNTTCTSAQENGPIEMSDLALRSQPDLKVQLGKRCRAAADGIREVPG